MVSVLNKMEPTGPWPADCCGTVKKKFICARVMRALVASVSVGILPNTPSGAKREGNGCAQAFFN